MTNWDMVKTYLVARGLEAIIAVTIAMAGAGLYLLFIWWATRTPKSK